MPDWPGRSLRDRAIRAYVGEHLTRVPGPLADDVPAVLLLGPRGSGKTSLLQHLATWGRAAPLAWLDLATMEQGDKTLFDVLTDLAYQLQARKEGPRMDFPSFTVLLLAMVAEIDTRDRNAAVTQMRAHLQARDQGDYSLESLQPLIDSAAAVAGGVLPGWVTQIVPAIRGTQRLSARMRINRRVARAAGDVGELRVGADFLVGANRLFHGYPQQRKDAEHLLFDAFIADLRKTYKSRSDSRRRTAHCLVLLDNADSALGDRFLQLLLDSRRGTPGHPGLADPLLVVAAARRPPQVLVREEQRLLAPRDYRQSWADEAGSFTPVPVGRLHAGLLRDLDRAEVEEHASLALAELPEGIPGPDNVSYWLGWITYAVSRGQPAVTSAVLDAISRFPADTPWNERIQRWPSLEVSTDGQERAANVTDATLDLLLADYEEDLRTVLPRAAAALTQGHAESADDLWSDVEPALRRRFEDDGKGIFHPAVRFLLLRRLDQDSGSHGPGSWDGAHRTLRSAASDDGRTTAYHDLARGRLDAAVEYLHGRFNAVPAEQWCDDLSYVQRAPARWPGGRPETPRDRYIRLVGTPSGDEVRQAITRLLAAGWITSHPQTDPYTELYDDPLGDPYTELYHYIAEEFRTLRRLTSGGERDRDVFHSKVTMYGRRPW